jgi:hypothetical protein
MKERIKDMATFIKGNDVANATSYELFEKNGSGYNPLASKNAIDFELDGLGLAAGNHILVVKAKADGYMDSDYSNEVTYIVANDTPADELAGTWLLNETISKENFGGKNGTVADLGIDAAAYRGYKVNFSIAPEGDAYNTAYEYLLANKSVEAIGFYNTTSNSAGVFYQSGSYTRSSFRTVNVYSKLAEVEDGDVLLAWFKANGVKQS